MYLSLFSENVNNVCEEVDEKCGFAFLSNLFRKENVKFTSHLLLTSGSFGHFQASNSGVHRGGLSQPLVKAGFVATRISASFLNFDALRKTCKP